MLFGSLLCESIKISLSGYIMEMKYEDKQNTPRESEENKGDVE